MWREEVGHHFGASLYSVFCPQSALERRYLRLKVLHHCTLRRCRLTTTKPYCMNPMLVQEMSIGVGSWCIQGLSLEVVASLRSSCRWERPALVQLSELSEPLSELSELSDDVRASSHRIYYRTLSERVLSDYRRRHYRTIGAIGVLSDAIGVYYRNYRTRAQHRVCA